MAEFRKIDTDEDDDDRDDDSEEEGFDLFGTESRRLATYWQDQIKEVDEDKQYKNWMKRGATIEKRYRDERTRTDDNNQVKRYNALWANVEILTPALYGTPPVPVAERRFRDKDPAGRGAAQILERALRNEVEISGFDEAVRHALRDYLLPGRGTVWVRYEPEMEEGVSVPPDNEQDISDDRGDIEPEDDSQDEQKLRETGDRVARESTPVDYIQWTDFYTFPCKARVWSEVVAVGKRVYMTRDQLKRRFGEKIGKKIPLQKDDRNNRRQETADRATEVERKASVYEIWSRTDEEVIWTVEGYQYLCDKQADPLKLENFFPIPRPLYANATNNTLIPVPDFIQYQDQAIQIDELTQRIAMLTKACKVTGVYNAAASSIKRLFNETTENELIPVDDWAAFAEKGGVEGNISFLPLKEIQGVINELVMIKEKCILEMDRLTGITDIMRGTTDARETLGGQRLKTNSAGTRLQYRQNEVARFARDTLRIMADIMCQHFSPQSLVEVSGALYEEGLGTVDMPSLTMLGQSSPAMGQAPRPAAGLPPAGGPMTGPPVQPPQAPGGPSFPPTPPPGIGGPPPGGPPRPGLPVPSPLGGLPAPMQPPMPQLPPQLLDKLQGLQRIMQAIQLLRNERLRGFRVDIEVDSTIYGDTQQEKGDRTAFIASVTQFLSQSMQISAAMPEAAPLLGKFLQFGVRGFRVGRDLEQAIEDFCDEAVGAAKMHQQQMQNQPNPLQAKAQSDMMKAKADMQSTQIKMQTEAQKGQAEIQRQGIENQGDMMQAQADFASKQADIRMREMEIQIEAMRLEVEKIKAEAMVQTAGLDSHRDIQKSQLEVNKAQMEAMKPPEPVVVKPEQSASLGAPPGAQPGVM